MLNPHDVFSDVGYYYYVMCISTGKSCDHLQTAKFRPAVVPLANFQNGDLTTIVTEQRPTFKSITYLGNVSSYCLIQVKCSPISMKVSVQLTYSHGYFVKFPHTGADLIAHLLFVFVIH